MKEPKSKFENEAELCRVFIAHLPEGWTAYAETAGFDILLVRAADGVQIGVEAKLSLNAKVILQAIGEGNDWGSGVGPDFRATLVPSGTAGGEMMQIAQRFGLTTIEMKSEEAHELAETAVERRFGFKHRLKEAWFSPELPKAGDEWRSQWVDHCPLKRCVVPDYVPDVAAGASGPTKLSEWKVKAIKICIILERRGWVCIQDFVGLKIHRQRWLEMEWLKLTDTRGRYIEGRRPIGLRVQHPVNYAQIDADYEKWAPQAPILVQEALL